MSQPSQLKALIMAGGTGGHIFPGIAVAKELMVRNWQVNWLGSKGGMEETLVAKHNVELNLISVKGLRGKGLTGWLKMPFSLFKAVKQAKQIIREQSPNIVIGFGGFASGPGGLAAFLTRTPLIIHEQNAIAGLTNKVLSRFACKVFQAFPNTFKQSSNKKLTKLQTVGNPIRKEILDLSKMKKANQLENNQLEESKLENNKPVTLLVMGGSRGALALNRELPKIFAELLSVNKVNIYHQVGKKRLEETKSFYREAGILESSNIQLVEFIDDIAESLNQADIVIARAGASTVSEIAAVGIATIFVPYPYAVDDHQTANAEWLVKANAALCFKESELTQSKLTKKLNELVTAVDKRQQMAVNARAVAYLNATQEIADFCQSYSSNNIIGDAA
jgi:UDP-N-acetylglucosamine--N-acetylmuramyl-(pentapeptide) pyrophosphoryl-undecaprenol N-acetylglucosamine transferase